MIRTLMARRSEEGFTLIELLVVVAIIAILSFTVVTNLSSARAKARDSRVASDLQAVSKGIDLYVANGESLTPLTGTQTLAQMKAVTGVIGALQNSPQKYLAAGLDLKHPANSGTYAYKGIVAAGSDKLDYFVCGSTETPTAAFYIIENGSGYTSATTKC